ncbi:MAG: DUF3575 domain-containing protein [Bacteroidota bacterium]|nr:DUF3575 domain-containing protein [Bacteroidota bacterium]
MKKNFTLLLLILFTFKGFTQSQHYTTEENEAKNLIKLNITALTIGSISAQYERAVSQKMTIGTSFSILPKRSLPFLNIIDHNFKLDDMQYLNNMRISSVNITPEVRWYFGKESFKGGYIGTYLRYAHNKVTLPIDYTYNNQEQQIQMEGNINVFSIGISLGTQWKLSDKIYLDWLILGPMIGKANFILEGHKNLNPDEQEALTTVLDGIQIGNLNHQHQVSNSGAKLKFKTTWGGVRFLLGIGYRF